MCFNENQTRDTSTLTDSSLKLVDKLTYLGSSVSSTENDINTPRAKAWSAIDWLSVIWKSDLSDKIKHNFFQAAVLSLLYIDAPHWPWLSAWRKSLTAITQECYEPYWINPLSSIPQNSRCTVNYLPSLKPFKSDEEDMQDIAGEIKVSS